MIVCFPHVSVVCYLLDFSAKIPRINTNRDELCSLAVIKNRKLSQYPLAPRSRSPILFEFFINHELMGMLLTEMLLNFSQVFLCHHFWFPHTQSQICQTTKDFIHYYVVGLGSHLTVEQHHMTFMAMICLKLLLPENYATSN